jgi:G:T-mismatch repair DNA endonuclease (very short patch repair protein)
MIKEIYIEIKGHRTNFEHFKKRGYDIQFKKPIQVKIQDLMSGSTAIITSICDNCGVEKSNEFRFYYEYTKGLKEKYFCNKCNNIKRKETCLEKWGVENPMQSEEVKDRLKNSLLDTYGVDHFSKTEEFKEKYKNTCLKNFGVDNTFKSRTHKEKIKKSNLEKFGVEYPQQNNDIKEKTTKSFLDTYGVERYSQTTEFKSKIKEISQSKWGVDNYSQTLECREKVKETSIENWGVEHYSKTDEFKKKLRNNKESLMKLRYENLIGEGFQVIDYQNSSFEIFHKECNRNFKINRDLLYSRHNLNICLCTKCLDINLGHSNMELEIQDFLNSLNLSYNKKDKTILEGKELDIYLPEYKLAIEMNGVYWHSEIYLDKYYHRDKTLKCKEKDIHLLHIWEDDWKYKRDITKSIILNKLNLIDNKIYARKCEIKLVDSNDSSQFLNLNHIQGSSPSQLKLGLYFNGELVSLMTFGWRFTNSKKEYELIRFCNKINYNVIGAASKLFSYFLKNYGVDEIISYSDISLFSGNLYQKLGFEKISLSKPNYFWVVDGIRKHRFNFNKKRLIKLGYDKNKSESQILQEIGYYRVYSCGQEKWIFTR